MAWTKPCNSKSRINIAGEILSGRKPPSADISLDVAYDIAGNWRSSHGYPLQVAWLGLAGRALRIDQKALIAKRIKRMPSIVAKLARFNNMQFARMQDLGGCRAIVRDINKVDELVRLYERRPLTAFEFERKCDYVLNPKPDGYRSVHLIYKYNRETQCSVYKGLRIEIQIRSVLQHTWATAVEIIDAFTGQGLKAGSNASEDDWKRFFTLVGGAVALVESRSPVPSVPDDFDTLCAELRPICERLHVPAIFVGIAHGVQAVEQKESGVKPKSVKAYVLTLDSGEKRTTVSAFVNRKEAEGYLLDLEKENKDKPHLQSVMALAGSLHGLRKAYPNYFLDTRRFHSMLEFLKMEPKKQTEYLSALAKKGSDARKKAEDAQGDLL